MGRFSGFAPLSTLSTNSGVAPGRRQACARCNDSGGPPRHPKPIRCMAANPAGPTRWRDAQGDRRKSAKSRPSPMRSRPTIPCTGRPTAGGLESGTRDASAAAKKNHSHNDEGEVTHDENQSGFGDRWEHGIRSHYCQGCWHRSCPLSAGTQAPNAVRPL
jgi:hypothetical protein